MWGGKLINHLHPNWRLLQKRQGRQLKAVVNTMSFHSPQDPGSKDASIWRQLFFLEQ